MGEDVHVEGLLSRLRSLTPRKVLAILIMLSAITYGNAFLNGFVYDDKTFILGTPEIRDLGNIPSFFSQSVQGVYRPVRTVFYALSFASYGTNPLGYHANALLLTIAASYLVFLITEHLVKRRDAAVMAGMLFAVFPVHTEAITFLTSSFDIIGIIFFLVSFLLYLRGRDIEQDKKRWKLFAISCAFALLAFLTYEITLTLPLVVILYEISFHPSGWKAAFSRKKLLGYMPFFLFAFGYVALRFLIIQAGPRIAEQQYATIWLQTMITMPKVILTYIWISLIPYPLTIDRNIPVSVIQQTTILQPDIVMSFAALAGLLIGCLLAYRRSRLAFFCGAWFVLTLLPVLNPAFTGILMAERYLFLPSFGFVLALALLLLRLERGNRLWPERSGRWLAAGVFVVLLFSYAAITTFRNMEYRDDMSFWSSTVSTTPWSVPAHYNLGNAFNARGEYDQAIAQYDMALANDPDYTEAYYNLGNLYREQGLWEKAVEKYLLAIASDPGYYRAYGNLGVVYFEQGLIESAIEQYQSAISLFPDYADAHRNLAAAYGKRGDFELAIEEARKAIELDDNNGLSHFNLGLLYAQSGRVDLAVREFEKAVNLEPSNQIYAAAFQRARQELGFI